MSKELRERRASPINEKGPALIALRASGNAIVEETFKGSRAEDRVLTSGLTASADGQTWEIPKMPWKPSHMSAYGHLAEVRRLSPCVRFRSQSGL